jgi:hypothetical protein
MATLQALMEYQRENEWRRAGVSEADIHFSSLSAIGAPDVGTFRNSSRDNGLLIVIRCPKRTARPWQGLLPAKPKFLIGIPENESTKTGTSGVLVTSRQDMFVSDYDLMSVWRFQADGFTKVAMASTTADPDRGPLSAEAKAIILDLNKQLESRIQHGCQDDYRSKKNPGVEEDTRFAAFVGGEAVYLPNRAACKKFYDQHKLHWPYDLNGKYNGPVASSGLR